MLRLALASVALLALAADAPAQVPDAQTPALDVTLGGGLGYGVSAGSDEARFAFTGTLAATRGALTVAAHGTYAEALDIFRSPTRRDRVGAVLVGSSWRRGSSEGRVLAGPSYASRVLHGDRIFNDRDCGFGGCIGGGGNTFERVERRGLGLMVRSDYLVFPLRDVPVGVNLEAGVNLSAAGATASLAPGLVVRFEQ